MSDITNLVCEPVEGNQCEREGADLFEVAFQVNQSAIMHISIFGKMFKCLVDTGSNLTYCSPAVGRFLLQNNIPMDKYGANLCITTAAQKTITLKNPQVYHFGFSNREGTFSAPISAIVLPHVVPDLILGMSTLNHLNAQFKFKLINMASSIQLVNKQPLVITPEYRRFWVESKEVIPFAGKISLISKIPGVLVKQTQASFNPYVRGYWVFLKSQSQQDVWVKPDGGLITAKYTNLKSPVITFRAHKNEQGVYEACGDCHRLSNSQQGYREKAADSPYTAIYKVKAEMPEMAQEGVGRPFGKAGTTTKTTGQSEQGVYCINRFAILQEESNDGESSCYEEEQDTSEVYAPEHIPQLAQVRQTVAAPEHTAGGVGHQTEGAEPQQYVTVFQGQGDVLSNFFPCQLTWQGEVFRSSEHAYQYHKALLAEQPEVAEYIRQAGTAREAKYRARKIPKYKLTESCKLSLMYEITWAKYQSVQDYRVALYSAQPIIAEAVQQDQFWSTGLNKSETLTEKFTCWPGLNHMGRIHMKIRDREYGRPLSPAYANYWDQFARTDVCSVAVQATPREIPQLGLSSKDLELQRAHKEFMTSMTEEEFMNMFVLQGDHLAPDQAHQLKAVLYKNRTAFRPPNNSLPLPPANIPWIQFPVKADVPKYRKPRPVNWPLERVEEAAKQIQELVGQGVLEETESNFVSDIVLVPKPNGKLRMAVDLRICNLYLQKVVSTTPNIKSLIQAIGANGRKVEYFSSVDMSSAFLQLPLDPSSSAILTIQCPKTFKRYSYRRLCFGSSLSPFFFQNAMTSIFHDMLGSDLFMFFDDCTLTGDNFTSHLATLDKTLSRMAEYCLSVNPSKSTFCQKSITFLAHELRPEGYRPAQPKLDLAEAIPTPASPKELMSVLCFFSFFRAAIKDFPLLSAELFRLARSSPGNFAWAEDHDRLFRGIKEAFKHGPVLSYPDYTKPFFIEVDTSGFATGSMLFQKYEEDGVVTTKVIAFGGNMLLERQRKYSPTQQELAGLVNALLTHQQHLFGQEITVYTDHQCLIPLLAQPNHVNNRVARFIATVASFNPKVIYKPGKQLKVVDYLSRLKCWPENQLEDLIHQRLFGHKNLDPDSQEEVFTFFNKVQAQVEHIDPAPLSSNQLHVAQIQDPYCSAFIQFLQDDKLENVPQSLEKEVLLTASTYLIGDDGLLYKIDTKSNPPKQLLVVPAKLVPEILTFEHEGKGHGGIKATLAGLRTRFHWKSMAMDVNNRVKQCQVCQNFKVIPQYRAAKTSTWPMCGVGDNLLLDVIGPFIPVQGFTHALVMMDEASRHVTLRPLRNLSSNTIATQIMDYFWDKGFCKAIRADNALYFQGNLMQQIYKLLRINNIRVATYSGFTQGAVERCIQSVKSKLRTVLEGEKSQWLIQLRPVAYAINTTPCAAFGLTSGITPAMLFYGRHLLSAVDLALPVTDVELPANGVDKFSEIIHQLVQAQIQARDHMVENMAKQPTGHSQTYHEGQLVLVLVDKLKTKDGGLMAKFERQYCGPFMVTKVVSETVLQLANAENREVLKNLINTRYCKPYYQRLVNTHQKQVDVDPDNPPPALSSEYLPRETRIDIERRAVPTLDLVNKNIETMAKWRAKVGAPEHLPKSQWPEEGRGNGPRPGPVYVPPQSEQLQGANRAGQGVTAENPGLVPDSGGNQGVEAGQSKPALPPHNYTTRSKNDPQVNKDYSMFFACQTNS